MKTTAVHSSLRADAKLWRCEEIKHSHIRQKAYFAVLFYGDLCQQQKLRGLCFGQQCYTCYFCGLVYGLFMLKSLTYAVYVRKDSA